MGKIRRVTQDDLSVLYELYKTIGIKEGGYFEQCLKEQDKGARDIFLIETGHVAAGYVILNRQPQYSLYQKLGMPEIQDLNVVPEYRRQGLGTQLILHCEKIAKDAGHDQIGMSVGLTSDYGPAQLLYLKLGYVPDGYGVTYDRKPVPKMSVQCIDDNLCLMLVKSLS